MAYWFGVVFSGKDMPASWLFNVAGGTLLAKMFPKKEKKHLCDMTKNTIFAIGDLVAACGHAVGLEGYGGYAAGQPTHERDGRRAKPFLR